MDTSILRPVRGGGEIIDADKAAERIENLDRTFIEKVDSTCADCSKTNLLNACNTINGSCPLDRLAATLAAGLTRGGGR